MNPRRQAAARKAAVTRKERDDFAEQNIPPDLQALWHRTKGQYRGPPHQRAEAFLEYAEAHPMENVDALQALADKRLAQAMKQRRDRDIEFPFGFNVKRRTTRMPTKPKKAKKRARGRTAPPPRPRARELVVKAKGRAVRLVVLELLEAALRPSEPQRVALLTKLAAELRAEMAEVRRAKVPAVTLCSPKPCYAS